MAKCDRPLNLKITKEYEEGLAAAVLKLDKSKSEVIRAAISVGLAILLAHPELVVSLGHENADLNNIVVLLNGSHT